MCILNQKHLELFNCLQNTNNKIKKHNYLEEHSY
jgi:hypothetical protein